MQKTKIFIIAGKARSGKNTIAKIIKDYFEVQGKKVVEIGFTDYIREYAKKITNWDGQDETKPRELLQKLGTDIVRNQINKDFFVNRVCEDIKVYQQFFDVIIISGARFPNELETPKKQFSNVTIIKVERPNFENELTTKQRTHITETALDNYQRYDYLIINDNNLEHLRKKTKKIIDEVNIWI